MINEQIIKKSEPQVHYSDIHEILTRAHVNVVHAFTAKYIIFELDTVIQVFNDMNIVKPENVPAA